jgi:predicted TIM-barrel fold metal-dependent hydrolase
MVVDSHIHLLPRRVQANRTPFLQQDRAFAAVYATSKATLASEEEIIDYLDRSEIAKAVVFGFPWADHGLLRENNDEVWAFHERYPDRIFPFAVLSPVGKEANRRETARTLALGFAGIGELAMYHGGWSPSDFEVLAPSVELAGKAGVPVLIHVNEPVGHEYPGKAPVDFRGLLRMIEAHPHVNFILAHWGGGIFFYALMPEVRTILARTYLDTAASPFLYSPDIYEIACRIMGADKILFGSDFPLLRIERYVEELEKTGLDEKSREAILGRNAEQLLK